jgi:hypothetical protein
VEVNVVRNVFSDGKSLQRQGKLGSAQARWTPRYPCDVSHGMVSLQSESIAGSRRGIDVELISDNGGSRDGGEILSRKMGRSARRFVGVQSDPMSIRSRAILLLPTFGCYDVGSTRCGTYAGIDEGRQVTYTRDSIYGATYLTAQRAGSGLHMTFHQYGELT